MSARFGDTDSARRAFLRFLLASPLTGGLAGSAGLAALGSAWPAPSHAQLAVRRELDALSRAATLIASSDEALNVSDFEPVMQARVNAGHFAYMAQGADDSTFITPCRCAGTLRYVHTACLLVNNF